MTGRMNWQRARTRRPIESKYRPGTVLRNGEIIPDIRDDMSRRADEVLRTWLKRLPTHQRRGL